ncbi:MAG TPA: Rieske 2Fe-2S domain-containing protein [Terracidiphilus sp.]|nr:Rieske 2Fe-2S domain-containing protein [Terracidiphilus sp.]
MAELVRICAESELPGMGKVKEFAAAGRAVCVANVNGAICVTDAVCPHEGGPLGEGTIEDGKLVCPWHSFAYDPRTGATESDPELHLDVFESQVAGGELRARL